jgi:hypothetical protein
VTAIFALASLIIILKWWKLTFSAVEVLTNVLLTSVARDNKSSLQDNKTPTWLQIDLLPENIYAITDADLIALPNAYL